MIVIKNLNKRFPGQQRLALKDINIKIVQGDFCVLLGKNGSGKSTLMKLINKELESDEGSIELSGKVMQISQNLGESMIDELSLLENIFLSLPDSPTFKFYTRKENFVKEQLKSLNLGLEERLDVPIKLLSGGQKQAVAILMAVLSGRNILLLDEHTSALDPKMQQFIMEYTSAQISKKGITTIMITHKLEDALKYGNRIIFLDEGKLVKDLSLEKKKQLTISDLRAFFKKEDINEGLDDVL